MGTRKVISTRLVCHTTEEKHPQTIVLTPSPFEDTTLRIFLWWAKRGWVLPFSFFWVSYALRGESSTNNVLSILQSVLFGIAAISGFVTFWKYECIRLRAIVVSTGGAAMTLQIGLILLERDTLLDAQPELCQWAALTIALITSTALSWYLTSGVVLRIEDSSTDD